ncbi:hypothetical protein Bca4012_065942 [Brassica carinata]
MELGEVPQEQQDKWWFDFVVRFILLQTSVHRGLLKKSSLLLFHNTPALMRQGGQATQRQAVWTWNSTNGEL